MNKLIASIAVFGLLAFVALPVIAAGEEVVTATVTPEIVSLTVDTPTVAYGTLALSPSDASRTTAESGVIVVTNNGTVNEDFDIKGTSTANWTLNSSPADTGTVATDQFVHRFDADATFTDGTASALSTSNQALGGGNVAPAGTQDFVLQMNMPTASTVSTEQSTTVTILATAT